MNKITFFFCLTLLYLMVLHGSGVVQNLAASLLFGQTLILQQAVGLMFADYADFNLRRRHVHVQFPADEKTNRARETRVGLHDLRRLFLDDKSTRN